MRPRAFAISSHSPVCRLEGALGGSLALAPLSLAQAAERPHDLLRPLTEERQLVDDASQFS
jgi:hypothetical protein